MKYDVLFWNNVCFIHVVFFNIKSKPLYVMFCTKKMAQPASWQLFIYELIMDMFTKFIYFVFKFSPCHNLAIGLQ